MQSSHHVTGWRATFLLTCDVAEWTIRPIRQNLRSSRPTCHLYNASVPRSWTQFRLITLSFEKKPSLANMISEVSSHSESRYSGTCLNRPAMWLGDYGRFIQVVFLGKFRILDHVTCIVRRLEWDWLSVPKHYFSKVYSLQMTISHKINVCHNKITVVLWGEMWQPLNWSPLMDKWSL